MARPFANPDSSFAPSAGELRAELRGAYEERPFANPDGSSGELFASPEISFQTIPRASVSPAPHVSARPQTTLEETQGQILSQSPTDATRFWWHLYGS